MNYEDIEISYDQATIGDIMLVDKTYVIPAGQHPPMNKLKFIKGPGKDNDAEIVQAIKDYIFNNQNYIPYAFIYGFDRGKMMITGLTESSQSWSNQTSITDIGPAISNAGKVRNNLLPGGSTGNATYACMNVARCVSLCGTGDATLGAGNLYPTSVYASSTPRPMSEAAFLADANAVSVYGNYENYIRMIMPRSPLDPGTLVDVKFKDADEVKAGPHAGTQLPNWTSKYENDVKVAWGGGGLTFVGAVEGLFPGLRSYIESHPELDMRRMDENWSGFRTVYNNGGTFKSTVDGLAGENGTNPEVVALLLQNFSADNAFVTDPTLLSHVGALYEPEGLVVSSGRGIETTLRDGTRLEWNQVTQDITIGGNVSKIKPTSATSSCILKSTGIKKDTYFRWVDTSVNIGDCYIKMCFVEKDIKNAGEWGSYVYWSNGQFYINDGVISTIHYFGWILGQNDWVFIRRNNGLAFDDGVYAPAWISQFFATINLSQLLPGYNWQPDNNSVIQPTTQNKFRETFINFVWSPYDPGSPCIALGSHVYRYL